MRPSSQRVGLITAQLPVHLDMYLYFIGENARTWYLQGGFEVVDPVLTGLSEPGFQAGELEGEFSRIPLIRCPLLCRNGEKIGRRR